MSYGIVIFSSYLVSSRNHEIRNSQALIGFKSFQSDKLSLFQKFKRNKQICIMGDAHLRHFMNFNVCWLIWEKFLSNWIISELFVWTNAWQKKRETAFYSKHKAFIFWRLTQQRNNAWWNDMQLAEISNLLHSKSSVEI